MRSAGRYAFTLLLLLPATAHAQTAAFLAEWRELSRVEDVPALRTRQVRVARLAAPGDTSALREQGLIALRLHELTGDPDDRDRARALFARAVEAYPDRAWAHFGHGLALAAQRRVRVRGPLGMLEGITIFQSIAEILGRDPLARAARAFSRAVELDPGLSDGAIELAGLALLSRDAGDLEAARATLHTALPAAPTPADAARLQLALSDVAIALGRPDEAAAAAEAAAEHGDPAAALRARAVALLRDPEQRRRGAELYMEGIEQLTAEAQERYFDDLRPIATEKELAEWRAAGPALRRALLRRAWEIRAARSGIPLANRLADHFQRLDRALAFYRRQHHRGAPAPGALLVDSATLRLPYDDRGIVLVRHGEPDRVVRTNVPGLRPNESWLYHQPDGSRRVFHFVVPAGGQDYVLVEDLFEAIDPMASVRTEEGEEAVIRLLTDRAPLDPWYQLLAGRYETARRGTSAITVDDVRMDARNHGAELRAAILDALRTDSDRPRFTRELPFYYDIYSFRGPEGRTELTAALAIPGEMMTPVSAPEGAIYALSVSFIVIDTLHQRVSRTDTTFHFRADRFLGAGEYLRTHLRVAAPPSAATVHRLVVVGNAAEPEQGQVYGGESPVPSYAGDSLMISSIVLAESDRGTWQRGGIELGLVPPRQFRPGVPLHVFYEVYNLPAGAAYTTEILLEPTERGLLSRIAGALGLGGGQIRLSFAGQAATAPDGTLQELRHVTPSIGPGRYRLRITVTHPATRTSATRETLFTVDD